MWSLSHNGCDEVSLLSAARCVRCLGVSCVCSRVLVVKFLLRDDAWCEARQREEHEA
jgi:hypothetical protein